MWPSGEKTEEGEPPALDIMLKQEEVAFIKALSSIELSPVFLRELSKAMAAGKKEKALAAPKVNATGASALEHPSGVGAEVLTSRDPQQEES